MLVPELELDVALVPELVELVPELVELVPEDVLEVMDVPLELELIPLVNDEVLEVPLDVDELEPELLEVGIGQIHRNGSGSEHGTPAR